MKADSLINVVASYCLKYSSCGLMDVRVFKRNNCFIGTYLIHTCTAICIYTVDNMDITYLWYMDCLCYCDSCYVVSCKLVSDDETLLIFHR